jgi:hypothetical protein
MLDRRRRRRAAERDRELAVRPVDVSTVQIPKSRSKATVLPSLEIDGHNTRPSLNIVTWERAAPGTVAPGTVAPARST